MSEFEISPLRAARVELEQARLGAALKYNLVEHSSTFARDVGEFEHPHDEIAAAISRRIREGRSITVKQLKVDLGSKLNGLGEDYLLALHDAAPALVDENDVGRFLEANATEWRRLRESEVDLPTSIAGSIPLLTSGDFVGGFMPPDYLIQGVLQRGFSYSLCAHTGHGKTALSLLMMACVANGVPFAGHFARQGRTLMLAGENPDDIRARWIALAEDCGFDAASVPVHFMPATPTIPDAVAVVKPLAERLGGFSLIVVDTGPAYFSGFDENANVEIGQHARDMRAFTQICGRPTVLINTHPAKHASNDALIPRGGGAFLAEVDGNLSAVKTDDVVAVHWQGKFRGPDFAPLEFKLATVTSDRLITADGERMPTVIARQISTDEATQQAESSNENVRAAIKTLAKNPGLTGGKLAEQCGWYTSGGAIDRKKAKRTTDTLRTDRLAEYVLDGWHLTPRGQRAAKALKSNV